MEEKNNLEQQSLFDFDCKCPVCGKNCDSYQQLITHINRSRKEHMALCSLCSRRSPMERLEKLKGH